MAAIVQKYPFLGLKKHKIGMVSGASSLDTIRVVYLAPTRGYTASLAP